MSKHRKRIPGSRRFETWPALHATFIQAQRNTPFAWGRNDCCLNVCNGIRAITGLDPAAKMFRGRYRGATGAMRLLKKHGGVESIAEQVCREYGFEEWPSVAQARRGDVVLGDLSESGPALGTCDGINSVFPGPAGAQLVPTVKCRRAWRVD